MRTICVVGIRFSFVLETHYSTPEFEYHAEWGVFAALQFRLHAKPSQVTFHFKRLLKSLEWNPGTYLGSQMYAYWQEALVREEYLRQEREKRREVRQQKKEEKKLLQLQREFEAAKRREKGTNRSESNEEEAEEDEEVPLAPASESTEFKLPPHSPKSMISPKRGRQSTRMGFLHRFGGAKRAMSSDKLAQELKLAEDKDSSQKGIPKSPSMPVLHASFTEGNIGDEFVIEINSDVESVHGGATGENNASAGDIEEGGIVV